MDDWADKIVPELMAVCRADAAYQEILHRCEKAEKDYVRIINGMYEEDREQLDTYLSLCEELQFQLARVAYHYGRQDPRK